MPAEVEIRSICVASTAVAWEGGADLDSFQHGWRTSVIYLRITGSRGCSTDTRSWQATTSGNYIATLDIRSGQRCEHSACVHLCWYLLLRFAGPSIYSQALHKLVESSYLKPSTVLSHVSPRDRRIKYDAEEKAKINGFPTAKQLKEAREVVTARIKREDEEAEKIGMVSRASSPAMYIIIDCRVET